MMTAARTVHVLIAAFGAVPMWWQQNIVGANRLAAMLAAAGGVY
jgi:hypothetical protein